nr:retrovirus-related Pol polyprotein from transposon TNT 1-94 [Tanacetum cinerariifolium]
MTRNLKLLTNFVEKFLGTVKFENDQIALILGYGDLSTCYIRDLKGNDLLTDKGTKFLNKTLHVYFASERINHQTSIARTPKQNGVVKRRNRTLVEAARTMLSAVKVPLFFWAKVIATACFTQNRSLIIPRHEKIPYHIINDRKPSVKFFHIFGSLCYIVRDGENLDKMKEKGDACIFVGYYTQSRAYRVFNKRKTVIVETIHVNFDELPQMASDHVSSDLVPQCQSTTLEHDNLRPGPQFVSKSSAKTTADAPNQCQQQHTTPLNTQTTTEPTCQVLTQALTVTSTENINQAEMISENAQVEDNEFINIFCTSVQDRGETSSRHVDLSNMHTFYQRHTYEHRWTKDHPLEQALEILLNQLEHDEELHQFDRLDVWELVDRPLCKNVINIKWLWKNKRDEENTVIRNKSRLVAMGYAQKEGEGIIWTQTSSKDVYLKDIGFELTAFSDSDHMGCLDSRKSTSSGIQFLGGDKLVSWSSKKQDCTSMSLAEAEASFDNSRLLLLRRMLSCPRLLLPFKYDGSLYRHLGSTLDEILRETLPSNQSRPTSLLKILAFMMTNDEELLPFVTEGNVISLPLKLSAIVSVMSMVFVKIVELGHVSRSSSSQHTRRLLEASGYLFSGEDLSWTFRKAREESVVRSLIRGEAISTSLSHVVVLGGFFNLSKLFL